MKHGSKSNYVRGLATTIPAKEVVYNIRSTEKRASKAVVVGATRLGGKTAMNKAVEDVSGHSVFRRCVADIGILAAEEMIREMRAKVAK